VTEAEIGPHRMKVFVSVRAMTVPYLGVAQWFATLVSLLKAHVIIHQSLSHQSELHRRGRQVSDGAIVKKVMKTQIKGGPAWGSVTIFSQR
jgi:hypothetical protein